LRNCVGFTGVGTLGCYHYCSSGIILRLIGSEPVKPFKPEEWRLKGMLVVIVVTAALASNFSLSLNTVSTYQLFKLLQTPILAVVEAATGFRALSPIRALLMVGVSCGVAVAELGGSHDKDRPQPWQGIAWAGVAVVATSMHKMMTAEILKSKRVVTFNIDTPRAH
jgi:predicted protein tyrosine phosphatase